MADVLVHRPARSPVAEPPTPLTISRPPGTGDASGVSNRTHALFPLMGAGGILVLALISRNPPTPGPATANEAGSPLEEPVRTMRRIAEAWPGEPARPIRLLPHHVDPAGLADDETGRRAPIGLRELNLRTAHVDLFDGPDPHLLVLGDAGTRDRRRGRRSTTSPRKRPRGTPPP